MAGSAETEQNKENLLDVARGFIQDARRFFTEELWDRDLSTLPRLKRFAFSACRVCAIVVKGFVADNCGLQASALTYISLMSMIPVLAVMFSFSKGIGMQNHLIEAIGLEKLEVVIDEGEESHEEVQFRVIELPSGEKAVEARTTPKVPPWEQRGFTVGKLPEPMQKVITTILSYVENTRFGTLGLAGIILLFWAAVKAMSKLENSFNQIWGISSSRPLFQTLAEYLFVLVLMPILFFTATSLNAALSSPAVIERLQMWVGPLAWIYSSMLRLFGIAVVVTAFTVLYKFMPNTRVKLFPAAVAGLVAGILWYITQLVYITFQVGLTRYNAIYGTFAAVPFFLAWLFMNWMIILFGAEVSFAVQNHRTYVLESLAQAASPATKALLGLVLTYETCRSYAQGSGPWCPSDWGRENAIPARMVTGVTETLEENGILVAVGIEEGRAKRVVPGRAIERITLADVEEAFRHSKEPYAQRLRPIIPQQLSQSFLNKYDRFMGELSDISFRDLLKS